ncbi:hypothetical protein DSM07_03390 [Oenococcus sp. UCMA 16435]|nr:hypothetical protein DSM07_03390 [Oenococcus sp. UCMA 16435]
MNFTITVDGQFPAKKIKLLGFEISDEGNDKLNLGSGWVSTPLTPKETPRKYQNLRKENANVNWQAPDLNVYSSKSIQIHYPVLSNAITLHDFLHIYADFMSEDDIVAVASTLVPVQARFEYFDIDDFRYDDLVVTFYLGLGIEHPNDEEIRAIYSKVSPLSEDSALAQAFIEEKSKRQLEQYEQSKNSDANND